MMEHGAFGAFLRDPAALPGDSIGGSCRRSSISELREAPRAQALARDAWLPGIQVMTARVKEGSAAGLYLAAQGGHNAESHNHNDVGNFLVYADGQPAIIDVGVETYTAKTFSSKRYEIWTMQSAYHNCPTIDGVMQAAGRQFAASDVNYRSTEDDAEFRLNIAKAYPPEAHLDSWIRTLRLTRSTNMIEVTEDYVVKQAPKEITLTFMTPCRVDASTAGQLSLAVNSAKPVHIQFDSAVFQPSVEEVPIEDARLRGTWGDRLYRIRLRATAPPAKGKWTLRIGQP